jgi:hypothetical protein
VPWLTLGIVPSGSRKGATLVVNRTLEIQRVVTGMSSSPDEDAAFWRSKWRVIVRNGQYEGQ